MKIQNLIYAVVFIIGIFSFRDYIQIHYLYIYIIYIIRSKQIGQLPPNSLRGNPYIYNLKHNYQAKITYSIISEKFQFKI